MFGIGSVAQVVLGKGAFGNFLSINFGWGLGCCLGVYWSAGISGKIIYKTKKRKRNFSRKFQFSLCMEWFMIMKIVMKNSTVKSNLFINNTCDPAFFL